MLDLALKVAWFGLLAGALTSQARAISRLSESERARLDHANRHGLWKTGILILGFAILLGMPDGTARQAAGLALIIWHLADSYLYWVKARQLDLPDDYWRISRFANPLGTLTYVLLVSWLAVQAPIYGPAAV